jgi:hypothetical protein
MAINRLTKRFFVATLAIAQTAVALSLALSSSARAEDAERPRIDLAFCIDTTGSMQNEIDNVKQKTKEIVAKIAGGKPAPIIRVGLVAYRDKGDEYVTRVYPFTQDIDKMVKDISSLNANGGGDTEEAVNEALHVSVHDLQWSKDKKTLKLLFLVGDAGPHPTDHEYSWETESKAAIANGIQINTIGCGILEQDPQAAHVFHEIAHLSDGKYEPLAYRQEIAQRDGKKVTVIASGGKTYRLKEGADKAAWMAGAKALEERGAAVAISAPAAPASTFSHRLHKTAAPLSEFAAAGAAMSVYGDEGVSASAGFGGAGVADRRENNLADVVLRATRDAAKKKLNVEFHEK